MVHKLEKGLKMIETSKKAGVVRDSLIFIHPADSGRGPWHELLSLEPEIDLLLGGLDGVRSVANITADLQKIGNIWDSAHFSVASPNRQSEKEETHYQLISFTSVPKIGW